MNCQSDFSFAIATVSRASQFIFETGAHGAGKVCELLGVLFPMLNRRRR